MNIKTVYFKKLKKYSISSNRFWVADNTNIYTEWVQYLKIYKLSDSRHKRYPTTVVNLKKLRLDIKPEESLIIRDIVSKEVIAVVIRNFAKDADLLDWASSTVVNKSVRVSISIQYI